MLSEYGRKSDKRQAFVTLAAGLKHVAGWRSMRRLLPRSPLHRFEGALGGRSVHGPWRAARLPSFGSLAHWVAGLRFCK